MCRRLRRCRFLPALSNASSWISASGRRFGIRADPHRYLVKFEAGGVIAELSGIGEFKPDAPTAYRDPSYKFGVTLPPTWTSFRRDPDEEKQPTTVFLLDPDAAALTVVQAQKRGVVQTREK